MKFDPVLSAADGKRYELSDHLGNVRAVISDVRQATVSANSVSFATDVRSFTDYYAFGGEIAGRKFNSGDYRFGFNGKENDPETGFQDYGMRGYNPQLGRFFAVDPIADQYPWYTPYQFAGNMPITFIDMDGLEPILPPSASATIATGQNHMPDYTNAQVRQNQYLINTGIIAVGISLWTFGRTAPLTSTLLGRATTATLANGIRLTRATEFVLEFLAPAGTVGMAGVGTAAAGLTMTPGGWKWGQISSKGLTVLEKLKTSLGCKGTEKNMAMMVASFNKWGGVDETVEMYAASGMPGKVGDVINETLQNEIRAPKGDRLFDAAAEAGRMYDSEVKLFEALARKMGATAKGESLPWVNGEVTLAQMLYACPNCQDVIQQFQNMFPNVNITIISTEARSYSVYEKFVETLESAFD